VDAASPNSKKQSTERKQHAGDDHARENRMAQIRERLIGPARRTVAMVEPPAIVSLQRQWCFARPALVKHWANLVVGSFAPFLSGKRKTLVGWSPPAGPC
jgi:hypothetical protein